MKIRSIEDLHADAGWRNVSFIKMTTDEGLVGWAEYRADAGNAGVTGVIRALGELLVGRDPCRIEALAALLHARTVQAPGGINQHAIAALLNSALDIKAKSLGVPVSALFGGPVRERIPLYWSHCGSYRLRHAERIGVAPVRTLDDIARMGEEVQSRGFRALKTSLMPLDQGLLKSFGPGFAWSEGWPELEFDRRLVPAIDGVLTAFRAGAGPDIDLMLDVNCHFRTEGFIAVARAVEPHRLLWLELDTPSPQALRDIRQAARVPIASCEAVYGRRGLRPFLEAGAAGVVVIDVAWNGFLESYKMAALADCHEVNVAPHNYGGCLGECISAQFAAAIPNLKLMEFDPDDVPWKNELVTHPPTIEDGAFVLSGRPGWGTDVDERAVRAHPPR